MKIILSIGNDEDPLKKILKNNLEPEHTDVATTLNNLAALYYCIERYDDALPLLERSLKIFESKLGPAHSHFSK